MDSHLIEGIPLATLCFESSSLVVRLSLRLNQVAHQAGAYRGFCSMERLGLGVFLLPPE